MKQLICAALLCGLCLSPALGSDEDVRALKQRVDQLTQAVVALQGFIDRIGRDKALVGEPVADDNVPIDTGDLSTTASTTTVYDSIFYLSSVDTDADTVTVGSGSVAIAGVWKSVSGLTDQAISSDTYIYVAVDRTDGGGTATMTNSVDSLPNGDDDTEVFPLWYIPYSGGITTSGIKDYRFTKHWMADS